MTTLLNLGKTIKLYLVEGVPTGILTAEIMNWTGKFLVVPRAQLFKLAARNDAKRTGIYFLIGADMENPHRDRVYIGESDDVFGRLTVHEKDEKKDFWTRTALVTSKDENLTKSHTLYLESRLIKIATEAGRAILDNGTMPEKYLPESEVSDMEYFLAQVQLVLPVLGFSFLQPKPVIEDTAEYSDQSPELVLKMASTHARAREINGEFIVLSGSLARKQHVESISKGYRTIREELIAEGKLAGNADGDHYKFTEDVPFGSPSAAACAVLGMGINGRTSWKISESQQTYADWQDEKLEEAAVAGGET